MRKNNSRGNVWTMAVAAALVLAALPAAGAVAPRRDHWPRSAGRSRTAWTANAPSLPVTANIYDEIGPKDSASWGLGIGVNATDNVEIGFLFGQQLSKVEIKGTATRELGDLTINSYHPYVAFNLTPADAALRPYLLIGFGATSYGGVKFTRVGGR